MACVCRNYACKPPATDIAEMISLIESKQNANLTFLVDTLFRTAARSHYNSKEKPLDNNG
jgi:hypothetical protein